MRLKDEEGFGLIEILVALTVFMIIMLAVAAAFGGSLNAMLASRHKTIAEQLGTQCLEQIRSMANVDRYDEIGVGATGNPPGTLAATSTTVVHGVTYTIQRTVSWVSDPIPSGAVTGANYKSVRCRVSEPSRSNPQVSFKTNIAPPFKPDPTLSHIKVTVLDYKKTTPVEGALVEVLNGPSSPRSDETPANGEVPFGNLTPNPSSGAQKYYDIKVTPPAGYLVLPEHQMPTSPSDPEGPARRNLAPGSPAETWNPVILVFKPATINVNLQTCFGAAHTLPSNVTVSHVRETATEPISTVQGTESFSTNTGQLTVTTINGKPLVPSLGTGNGEYTVSATSTVGVDTYSDSKSQIVPDAYPSDLTGDFVLTMKLPGPCPTPSP